MRHIAPLLILVIVAGGAAFAQTDVQSEMPKGEPVMVSLFDPIYPPLASLANITGDVELQLGIKNDGSVESAVVVSGHPMLKDAALDSARRSRFECPRCRESVTPYALTYSFRLVAGPDFPCPESHQHVTRTQNHITVTGEPRVVDPYFTSIAVPAAKCLYLWRCGSRWGGEDYYFYPVRSVKCLDLWNCGHRLREPFATCKRLYREVW